MSLPRSAIAVPASFLLLAAVGFGSGCASQAESGTRQEEDEGVGQTSSALVDADPVSKAITDSCTTASVKGLGTQLVGEIQCLRPGTMARIDDVPNTTLGDAVFPFLQAPAAAALRNVAKTRNVKLVINSALRTLPQQFLLYRWYQTGRCGIGLAAAPGRSNHESGVAVDVNDNAGWRAGFQGNGWRWLGASDPVHYDFTAGGVSLAGLSVRAFQRLWNKNNPTDKVAEDGVYGATTETRLARSPIGGFPLGPSCSDAGTPAADGGASADGGAPIPPPPDLPNDAPMVPDAPEPGGIPEEGSPGALGAAPRGPSGSPGASPGSPSADELRSGGGAGCSSTTSTTSPYGGLGAGLLLAMTVLVRRVRRSRRVS